MEEINQNGNGVVKYNFKEVKLENIAKRRDSNFKDENSKNMNFLGFIVAKRL